MSTSISNLKEDPSVDIRLRRMNSATSSTYTATTLPPYTSTTTLNANPFLSPADNDDDASSINSVTNTNTNSTATTFIPTHAFHIQTIGKARISFPLPPKDLIIPIYSIPLNTDFTSPTAPLELRNPQYTSIRPERRSGSCSLFRGSSDGTQTQTPLATTTYVFGPGRPPKIWLSSQLPSENANGEEEFEMRSKSLFHRTVAFTLPNSQQTFEWRYAGSKEKRRFSNPPPSNLLLLERVGFGKGEGKEERVVVARLVRSDETRTVGSKGSCAGNGGLLEVMVYEGEEEQEEGVRGVRIEMVIVTCLVMLKKEIDRLRAVQIGVMSGAGS